MFSVGYDTVHNNSKLPFWLCMLGTSVGVFSEEEEEEEEEVVRAHLQLQSELLISDHCLSVHKQRTQ